MGATETKSIAQRIEDLDRRIIYACIIVLIIFPALAPGVVPVNIVPAQQAIDYYNVVNALTPDDTVLFAVDLAGSSWPAQGPGTLATLRLMFRKKCNIIMVHFGPQGPSFTMSVVIPLISAADKEGMAYGEKWVDLGYFAGKETAMSAIVSNLHVGGVDYYGTPLSQIPLMQDHQTYADITLLDFVATFADEVLRQFWAPHPEIPIVGIWHAAHIPTYEPFYQSGQILGYLGDLKGGAEFEQLASIPGLATARMGALTTTNYFAIVMIVLGNILWLVRRFGGEPK